jgi:hypothetical protein
MPEGNTNVNKETKIKALWFFCAVWTIDSNLPDWQVEHMISFTTQDPGALKTAFSEERTSIGDKWLNETSELVP